MLYISIDKMNVCAILTEMLYDEKTKMKLINEKEELFQINNEDLVAFMVDFLERLDIAVDNPNGI